MNLSRTSEWVPSEVIDGDLSSEEVRRLERVDALLRAVAAYDRHQAVGRQCLDARSGRSDAKW